MAALIAPRPCPRSSGYASSAPTPIRRCGELSGRRARAPFTIRDRTPGREAAVVANCLAKRVGVNEALLSRSGRFALQGFVADHQVVGGATTQVVHQLVQHAGMRLP